MKSPIEETGWWGRKERVSEELSPLNERTRGGGEGEEVQGGEK